VITDQSNGTYTVTLPPNLSGKCELSVQFEGQHIKGSPLALSILPNQVLPNDFFGGSKRFEVLYDARVHGYSNATFHQKCDNIDGTVILVTLQNGAKFGGYNPSRWTSEGGHKNIPNTFLFSLTDGKGSGPQKWQCTNQQYAICCNSGYGPSFGGGKFISSYFVSVFLISSTDCLS